MNNNDPNAVWERDLKQWLRKCKAIPNPTAQDVTNWDEILNGTSADPEDLTSLEKLTGWKKK